MNRIQALWGSLIVLSISAGSAAAQIAVDQDSERNEAIIQQHQSDNGAVKDRVFTTGNDRNSVTHVQQRGAVTDEVAVTQDGSSNSINAHQRAETNALSATQTGETNTARVQQTNP